MFYLFSLNICAENVLDNRIAVNSTTTLFY